MSEDIYAKPDFTKKVRFQSGEKDKSADVDDDMNNVTIYDNYWPEGGTLPKSLDSSTDNHQQTTSVTASSEKNLLKVAAGFLGLLCLFLLAAVIVLAILLIQHKNYWNIEGNRLWVENADLTSERDKLQTNYSEMTSINYNLTLKTSQLKTEKDLLNATNNNLIIERDELQTNYSEMTSINYNLTLKTSQLKTEKDLLNATNNNLIIERDELQKQLDRTRCPDNWIKFDNSCYLRSTSKKNWYKSKKVCEDHDAHLVIISTIMEQKFLNSLDMRAWIGMSDKNSGGNIQRNWRWVNGQQVTKLYWAPKQPDNYKSQEYCVEIATQECSLTNWNDNNCNFSSNFICEKTLQ